MFMVHPAGWKAVAANTLVMDAASNFPRLR